MLCIQDMIATLISTSHHLSVSLLCNSQEKDMQKDLKRTPPHIFSLKLFTEFLIDLNVWIWNKEILLLLNRFRGYALCFRPVSKTAQSFEEKKNVVGFFSSSLRYTDPTYTYWDGPLGHSPCTIVVGVSFSGHLGSSSEETKSWKFSIIQKWYNSFAQSSTA